MTSQSVNGISATNLNWWVEPGFLNHQQYALQMQCFATKSMLDRGSNLSVQISLCLGAAPWSASCEGCLWFLVLGEVIFGYLLKECLVFGWNFMSQVSSHVFFKYVLAILGMISCTWWTSESTNSWRMVTTIWFAKVSVFFWCPLCLCAWDLLASWHYFFPHPNVFRLDLWAIITTPPWNRLDFRGVCDPNGHVVLRVSPKSMVPANGDRWGVRCADLRNQRVHILNGRILVRGIKRTGIDVQLKSHFVKRTTIGSSPCTF